MNKFILIITYYWKGNNDLKTFIGYKGALSFYRKEGLITIEKKRRIKSLFLKVNLTYYCKGNNDPKTFIGYKGALGFYRKEGLITIEKK